MNSGAARGFTLVEMVITLALVGLLAMTAVPLYEVTSTRLKESELRVNLRLIRNALDAYKTASDQGQIPRAAGDSGYPPSLDILVQGVDVGTPGAVNADGSPAVHHVFFLRRIPRDPFVADPATAPADSWQLRSYASSADDPQPGADVYDVSSRSNRIGLNGLAYKQW